MFLDWLTNEQWHTINFTYCRFARRTKYRLQTAYYSFVKYCPFLCGAIKNEYSNRKYPKKTKRRRLLYDVFCFVVVLLKGRQKREQQTIKLCNVLVHGIFLLFLHFPYSHTCSCLFQSKNTKLFVIFVQFSMSCTTAAASLQFP